MAQDKLSIGLKVGYGVGDLGGNLFFTVVAFWLMIYLTDEVGLSASLAGVAILIGKIWDAVTDPMVGFLSDKTRSRWGRRRPWFLFASVPLGLTFFYMFVNPHLETQTALFLWAAGAYMLLCTVYTCVNIPYNALTPELTTDYHERTVLNGYRMMFAVVGTLIGAGTALPLLGLLPTRTGGYMLLGAVYGAIMTLSSLGPFFAVREPVHPPQEGTSSVVSAYRDALHNRPFVLILLPWVFNVTGITVVTATLIYYFKYVYNNEKLLTTALVILLLTSMVFIPIAVRLSSRIGKKLTYILGMALFTVALLVFFFFGHVFGIHFAYGVMFFAGVGFSTHYVMPWSMVPDTVELDYANSGLRREGIYYGLWTFAIKVGQALAGFLVGVVLDLFHYVPDVAQTADALLGIRLLVGPITAVFFIVGIIVLAYYPIDKDAYEKIRARIDAMEKASKTAMS